MPDNDENKASDDEAVRVINESVDAWIADDQDRAKSLLKDFLARDPSVAGPWIIHAIMMLHDRRFADAADACRRTLKLEPDIRRAHGFLGQALIGLCRFDEACEELRKMIQEENRARWHVDLATALYRKEDLVAAAQAAQEALLLEPDNVDALVARALAVQGPSPDEAETLLRRACQVDPDDRRAAYELGLHLRFVDRYEDSETFLRKALEIEDDAWIRTNLAFVLSRQGRLEEAEREYVTACRGDPTSAYPMRILAAFYWENERVADAERAYRAAVAIDPKCVRSAFRLAQFLKRTGATEEAFEWVGKALELDREHEETLALLHELILPTAP